MTLRYYKFNDLSSIGTDERLDHLGGLRTGTNDFLAGRVGHRNVLLVLLLGPLPNLDLAPTT